MHEEIRIPTAEYNIHRRGFEFIVINKIDLKKGDQFSFKSVKIMKVKKKLKLKKK